MAVNGIEREEDGFGEEGCEIEEERGLLEEFITFGSDFFILSNSFLPRTSALIDVSNEGRGVASTEFPEGVEEIDFFPVTLLELCSAMASRSWCRRSRIIWLFSSAS